MKKQIHPDLRRPLKRAGVVNLATLFLGLSLLMGAAAQTADWRQWRGPFNTGMAVGDAPLRWSDQSFIASPIIVDGAIYLRSRTHLIRIG